MPEAVQGVERDIIQKIMLQHIKEHDLLKSAVFNEFRLKKTGLNSYLNDDIILCYQNRVLYSFLEYTMDQIDFRGIPYPNSKLYLDQIWTIPEYRNKGYGTIILNGFFAIAVQEKRGIRAITSKTQWFEKRGFSHNATENDYEISFQKILLDNSVINRIKSGEIHLIGILPPN